MWITCNTILFFFALIMLVIDKSKEIPLIFELYLVSNLVKNEQINVCVDIFWEKPVSRPPFKGSLILK